MVSPGASNGIRAAREAGVTVVLSSRAPMGRTLPRYGTELGAATLVRSGVLLGGDLAPAKLRLLLMVVLAVTGAERDVAELVRAATC